MRPARRQTWLAGALVGLGLGACVPGYRLEAASGGTAERATVSGFSLTASVNAWPGGTRELVGEVLPIWIQVKNRSTTTARVRYADFGAIDEHGFWFGVVDPKTGRILESPPAPVAPNAPAAPSAPDAPTVPDPTSAPAAPTPPPTQASRSMGGESPAMPVLVFDTDSAWNDEHSARLTTVDLDALACEQSGECANVTLLLAWNDDTTTADVTLVGHHGSIGGRGFGGPPRSGYGFGGSGYYGGYYGYGYPYYGYSGYGYPYYGGYYGYGYYGSGWPYYPRSAYWPYYGYGRSPAARAPSTAMMSHVALAEGELKPGATTAGFVYLPSAARRAKQLDVTWAVHSSQAQPLAEVGTRFVSVVDE